MRLRDWRYVQNHFESFIGEILRRIPPKDRKTLTTVVVDSWERGKQNYTDSIYLKFRQRFGYELDYTNPACQNDLNHLISDLVSSEYMGGLTEKAHEYGLRTWCEPYAHSPFPGNSSEHGASLMLTVLSQAIASHTAVPLTKWLLNSG